MDCPGCPALRLRMVVVAEEVEEAVAEEEAEG
jgi:hypothetical protein